MSTMKAVVMKAVGDVSGLQLDAIAMPTLQTDTQILVRLKAAGVNPVDTKIRRRGVFVDSLPAVLGCDGA
ncbi:MAG: alcohol dehydrogenase, partial [Cyanobacteria bacterium P01_D01_bin.44]